MSQMTTDMFSISQTHVLSSFMTYHRVVTRVIRRVPLVMQELFTLLKTWIHPQLFVVFVLIDCFLFNAFKSYSALSIFLRFTESDYSFGIFKLVLSIFFWLLCCMSFFDLRILITLLVSSNSSCLFSFSHCVACPSSFYGFWLPLWYLQTLIILLFDMLFRQWKERDCTFIKL